MIKDQAGFAPLFTEHAQPFGTGFDGLLAGQPGNAAMKAWKQSPHPFVCIDQLFDILGNNGRLTHNTLSYGLLDVFLLYWDDQPAVTAGTMEKGSIRGKDDRIGPSSNRGAGYHIMKLCPTPWSPFSRTEKMPMDKEG
jgi:hypothetical protein